MATIKLNANKISQMPGLINDIKQCVIDYKSELSALKAKTLKINKSICNLDDVIILISSSTITQEEKVTSLDNFSKSVENYADEVDKIDSNVADMINESKDDFYDQYDYLKPECEKSGWEKFCDGCESFVDWCTDTWQLIVEIAKDVFVTIGKLVVDSVQLIVEIAIDVFVTIGKLIVGSVLAIAGLAIAIRSLSLALLVPGGGFLLQAGFSTMMYGAFMVGSVFDSQIQTDMDAIGWNPFNSDTSMLTTLPAEIPDTRKVSFYKGMPVVWSNHSNGRSGSFLGIWLTGDNDSNDIKHEWGHGVQQGIMGPLKYALMIGLPSWQEWGPSDREYYNRPWEISADMFGGVTRPEHTQDDIVRGWIYFGVSTLFGKLGYALVPY